MIDKKKVVCQCNDVTTSEVIEYIKNNNVTSLETLLEQSICPVGDKCEACQEEGYENDGFSLAMLLSLVKQKRV